MAAITSNVRFGPAARLFLTALLMFLLASAGIELTRYSDRIASVWLANGAVLAVMMRTDRREWPSLAVTIVLSNTAANLANGDAILSAAALSLCNLLEVGLMLALLGSRFGLRSLDDPQSIFRFAIFASVAPILPGAIAALMIGQTFDWATLRLFGQWYLADALGLMMVTPLVLAWSGQRHRPVSLRSVVEPGAMLLAIVAVSAIVFTAAAPRLFLVCPLFLLAGLRLRIPSAALVAVASAAMATGYTVAGLGPIAAATSTAEGQILLLQAYFAVGLVLTIPVSAITGQRDSLERALSARERQFRLMAEASPAGILQFRLDGMPLYVNARWVEMTGVDLEGIRSNGWDCVVPVPDRERARKLWDRVHDNIAEASECLPCDFFGRPSGWGEFFVTPERDDLGQLVGWVVRLMDVTDRMESSRALRDSEALYRLLAENTRDIIMRLDLDGQQLFVSSASELILGIKPEDMIGKPAAAFIHPDDWVDVQRSLKRLTSADLSPAIRYRERRGDGTYLWVEATYHLVRDPGTGTPIEIVASVRDIDLRHKAELIAAEAARKLRESNRLLTMAENLALVGHWHVGPGGETVEISSQAGDMTALDRSVDITPAQAFAIVDPVDRRPLKRAVVTAMRGRSAGNCRIRITRPDGMERYLDVAIQAERSLGRDFAGLFGVVHDVSQKVADERQLVEALHEARAAADAKSSFLATMSHEIRTPMTGVLGMIDLLRDDPGKPEREKYLNILKQSATLLMAVLNDVLDFSKLGHNRLEIHGCDFDFEVLAQSTLDLFFNAASQKGLLISLSFDASHSPFVVGDPVRIQQVISNLINNAIKFTDTGSISLRVKARVDQDQRQLWRIEVRDTGIGIPQDQVASLFDPFTQGDKGTGRRFGGTGLGLAISRRLVEAMDGVISVDSKPGKGSNFWFELPLAKGAAPPVRSRPTRTRTRPARPLKVLVAEDNPVNQLLISALLRRLSHVPTCVEDGSKAVEAAMATRFDCILMDMQMPVMDGITATRSIRQSRGPCATIPIIALTADASPERRRFYDNAGLTDFMTKPIDGEALADRLAAIASSDTAPEVEPALDGAHLDQLRAALGPKRLRSLLDLFLTELDQRPNQLRDHLLAGRLDQVKTEAHSLKGAAWSVGATRLGEAAMAMERLEAATDTKANTRLLDELENSVEAARSALGHMALDGARADGTNA